MCPHSLLVHQLLIWAIVDHAIAKDGRRELPVDIFGVEVRMLAVEDEVVALCAEIDGVRRAQQDEGKAVAVLGPALGKELVRVHAILHRAAYPGEDVEDDGRAFAIREPELRYHILGDGDGDDKRYRQRYRR